MYILSQPQKDVSTPFSSLTLLMLIYKLSCLGLFVGQNGEFGIMIGHTLISPKRKTILKTPRTPWMCHELLFYVCVLSDWLQYKLFLDQQESFEFWNLQDTFIVQWPLKWQNIKGILISQLMTPFSNHTIMAHFHRAVQVGTVQDQTPWSSLRFHCQQYPLLDRCGVCRKVVIDNKAWLSTTLPLLC